LQVKYTFPEELGTPILQISEARKAKAYHKIAPGMDHQSSLKEGQSMEGALKGCQHQIRGGTWTMPSQLHFYMEPQTALAQGDGEGGMEVGLLLCIFALECKVGSRCELRSAPALTLQFGFTV
jgi:xanthine dehydrogenase molybdopterin-binding subunit B